MKTENNTTKPETELKEATCSASLAREIAALETQLKPLLDRMATLRRKEREALSCEFIAV